MGILAKSRGQKVLIPSDTYSATCINVAEVGTHEYMGKEYLKVVLTWELSTTRHKFNEDEEEKPFTFSKEYTVSLHKKANLRRDLEKWRDKPFSADELKGFDLGNVCGVSCSLTIGTELNAQGDKRNVVELVKPLSETAAFEEPHVKPFVFEFGDVTKESWEGLKGWIQEKIKESKEWDEYLKKKIEALYERGEANEEESKPAETKKPRAKF